jgi:hypothetical protein
MVWVWFRITLEFKRCWELHQLSKMFFDVMNIEDTEVKFRLPCSFLYVMSKRQGYWSIENHQGHIMKELETHVHLEDTILTFGYAEFICEIIAVAFPWCISQSSGSRAVFLTLSCSFFLFLSFRAYWQSHNDYSNKIHTFIIKSTRYHNLYFVLYFAPTCFYPRGSSSGGSMPVPG